MLDELAVTRQAVHEVADRLPSRLERVRLSTEWNRLLDQAELTWTMAAGEETCDDLDGCVDLIVRIEDAIQRFESPAAVEQAELWLARTYTTAEKYANETQLAVDIGAHFRPEDGVVEFGEVTRTIYEIVSHDDPVYFAVNLLHPYESRFDEVVSSQYHLDLLVREIKDDRDVRKLLANWRSELGEYDYRLPAEPGPLLYIDREFEVELATDVWSSDPDRTDKLRTIRYETNGSCDLSFGAWSRITWGQRGSSYSTVGYVRLSGMPESLKARVEQDVGKTVFVRWRWSGIAEIEYHRSFDYTYEECVLVPARIRLEFVDADGQILWTFR